MFEFNACFEYRKKKTHVDQSQGCIPNYCEFYKNHPVEFNSDEVTQASKWNTSVFLDQVTDEQVCLYRKNLEDISIYLVVDVLSC